MTAIKASYKEQMLCQDLSWLVKKADLIQVCQRMGWQIYTESSTHIITYCPDHHLFVGKKPSHPKFYINKETGETFCQTEARGSNIVYTISRLTELGVKDVFDFIMGHEVGKAEIEKLKSEVIPSSYIKPEMDVRDLEWVYENLKDRKIYDSGYAYMMKPPNKRASNITKETLDHFQVFQVVEGYYDNRIIVPVFKNKELTGFVATDILGEKEWLKRHSNKTDIDYRKVLYPKGFQKGQNLFNFDGVGSGAETLVVTEGVRDAMKVWQCGIKNVVSTFGTSVSFGQVELFSSLYPVKIAIMFDTDEPGLEAAEKAAKKLRCKIATEIAVLPYGIDPKAADEKMLKKSLEKLFF